MVEKRQTKQFIWPPPDQWFTVWGVLVIPVIIILAQILLFFMNLYGARWITVFAVGLSLGAAGAGLILYAKWPLYRQRRFLTFGAKALPEHGRPYYRWGYRCIGLSVFLFLWLLLFGRA